MVFAATFQERVAGFGHLVGSEGTVRFLMDVTRFDDSSATGNFSFASESQKAPVFGIRDFLSIQITGAKSSGGGHFHFEGIGIATFANGTREKMIYNVDVFDRSGKGSDIMSINFPEMPVKRQSISGTVQGGDTTVTPR